jgi:[protein-PII] uridylyltransferase
MRVAWPAAHWIYPGEVTIPSEDPAPANANGAALRDVRAELIQAVLAHELPASEFPRRYATVADAWLRDLFQQATGAKSKGFALLAVGGYGRGELSPGSDLDLVLLHRARRRTNEVANRLWYAIWDQGLHLDHSVRTKSEALQMARSDLKVILGLLDARLIAGDVGLAGSLAAEVGAQFAKDSTPLLMQLEESVQARHKSFGELAFLLEPDLKQSAGGLRDLGALRAIVQALPSLAGLAASAEVASAESTILAARVALQCRTGSTGDRLLLQEQDQVAEILEVADADVLMAAVAEAGRAVAATSAEAWRRARAIYAPVPTEDRIIGNGLHLLNGEVALEPGADPAADPSLLLRVALAAAERHALISEETINDLAAHAVAPSDPWDLATRDAFLALLQTGDALIPVVESLDQRHLFELLIPEWSAVRNRPQRNAYHRFTVDRHLLEAVARAAEHLGEVDRPDLLVLSALLHDIGKGFPGDHSEVGTSIAETIATRIGLPPEDVETIADLVAFHLVLPEFATRRDLDDPSTAAVVARVVKDRDRLSLLAALTQADGQATGTAAWGGWKAELVQRLVERAGEVLDGKPVPVAPVAPTPEQLKLMAAGQLAIVVTGRRVTVVAPDRPGLLAAVTGVLALNGCNVRRATAGPGVAEMAVDVFDVEPAFDRLPDWDKVQRDLAAALEGVLALDEALARQEDAYARSRRPSSAHPAQHHVHVDDKTSDLATIVEVRAPDRVGLLHHIAAAYSSLDLDVVSAIVDTLGHEVIDTFYVREDSGDKLSPGRTEAVSRALEAVIGVRQ